MPQIDINVTDNSAEVLEALSEQIQAALEVCGTTAEGYAKLKCPVDTGNLRNSITHTTTEDATYIGTNVEYAAYVEMGTVHTPAQPYLRPAINDHLDQYKSILKKILK